MTQSVFGVGRKLRACGVVVLGLAWIFVACSSSPRNLGAPSGGEAGESPAAGDGPDAASAGRHSGESGSAGTSISGATSGGGSSAGSFAALGGSGNAGTSSGGSAGQAAVGTLGASCNDKGQCNSGFCIDGVCCDAACTGNCEQCSTMGHCEMPDDDAACGSVACTGSSDCQTYPASLTDHRCKARGTCKSAADCQSTFVAARTPCGADKAHMLCDGAGTCQTPTVPCGTTSACPVSASLGLCCGHSDGGGYAMCSISADSCAPASAQATIPIECNQGLDCATGTICCYHLYKYGSSMRCMPPSQCVSDGSSSSIQMCSPTDPNPCPLGTVCAAADAMFESYMSSYYYCK